ncbi:MAG TPA: TlpA disulfide reductase family protein [Bryobacteraceae bacterium]|nr:TlpA disulfide reductase family protein [Bryobacteraceae bacterium]
MRIILTTLLLATTLLAAGETRRAPGFSLPDAKMQEHDLADYRGKVVVLEFMQTTCPHCAAFAGVLNEVEQKYGSRVQILAVANPPDDQAKVGQYISGHNITYPVLFDCGQMAYSYLRTPSFDLPHVYVIDAAGMIREEFGYSALTREIFEGKGLFPVIDRLLQGGGTAHKSTSRKK